MSDAPAPSGKTQVVVRARKLLPAEVTRCGSTCITLNVRQGGRGAPGSLYPLRCLPPLDCVAADGTTSM